MDMKKILQALDGASLKPVEGSNDIKRFLRVVKEADLNQTAEPPMPGQNMPPAQVNLDHIDAKTLDSAEGFKAAMKQAASEAGVEPETAQMVDKLVAAAPDGTVDVNKTFVKMAVMFGDAMNELVLMLQELIKAYENAMSSPEFAQFDAATKQSVKEALAGLKAELPKIMANAKKMSTDAKSMQSQTASAPQVTNEQLGMSRFLSIVTEGKGPLNRLTSAESLTMQQYNTTPVLNVAKNNKPSLIGKYFKQVETEMLEAQERSKNRARKLAEVASKKIMERIPIGPGVSPEQTQAAIDAKQKMSQELSRQAAQGQEPSLANTQPQGPIDYSKDGPKTKSSLGHDLEYGIPVNAKGSFMNPNRLSNYEELPDEEYAAMITAYKTWLKDFLRRWPSATQNPDGTWSKVKPGLAPMYPKQ